MPRPTEPVKRVCYADDITVWATGVKISDLEDSINKYLEEGNTRLFTTHMQISSQMTASKKLPKRRKDLV